MEIDGKKVASTGTTALLKIIEEQNIEIIKLLGGGIK